MPRRTILAVAVAAVAVAAAFSVAGCATTGSAPAAAGTTTSPAPTVASPSVDTDSDGDGYVDSADLFPNDANSVFEQDDQLSADETLPTEDPSAGGGGDSTILAFGDTTEYTDGLQVTVGTPKPFKPSQNAAGGEKFRRHVKLTIRIKNGTDKAVDLSIAIVTASSAGVEGDEVFDDGLEGAPSTKVLPGKSITYPVAFGVQNPKDLTVQIAPGFDYNDAIFTNTQ